jgi:hypothetical protein
MGEKTAIEANLCKLSNSELASVCFADSTMSVLVHKILVQRLHEQGMQPVWSDKEPMEPWQVDIICHGFDLREIKMAHLIWFIERNMLTKQQKLYLLYEMTQEDAEYQYLGLLLKMLELNMWTLEDVRMSNILIHACSCYDSPEIENKHVNIVEKLLELGLTIDEIRADDNKALRVACSQSNTAIVQCLINHGLKLNDIRANNNESFRHACLWKNIDLVTLLWSQGLTKRDMRANNNEAFQTACTWGCPEIVYFLLDNGLNAADMHSKTWAKFADNYDYMFILLQLQDLGLSVDKAQHMYEWRERLYVDEDPVNPENEHNTGDYIRILEIFLDFGIFCLEDVRELVMDPIPRPLSKRELSKMEDVILYQID